ncbi:His Kinase A (phospho-acceptor) domain-containing protein [Seinonella peptonophila]|uniref:histidine kinase n=2 Tax=Seinonella peptonophila TaxID=112248 RepID=A0A1M4YE19_9BACL|nr:His Kinase A (phospho-acceptor) domain-containing protein [Seinonella peptonophila]
MNNMLFIYIAFPIITLFFLYREWRLRLQIQHIAQIVDEIIAGNEGRRIFVRDKTRLAPLVFRVNRLVETFQADKIRALRADKARKQMLTSLSHDVRTPLTSILGYLDALSDGTVGLETKEYIQIVRNKAYSLQQFIDELFMIAQIDANELNLTIEPIDLFELLRNELIGWIPRFKQKRFAVEIQIPDDEPIILGDSHALLRVIDNLLQNATRYGERKIGLIAWIEEEQVIFEIWNDGMGLSSYEVEFVFDRLHKGRDSARSERGYGLGLAIAKELLEKMNGSIQMVSKPQHKTTVRVSFPLSKKK